jgi:hypothetical protein
MHALMDDILLSKWSVICIITRILIINSEMNGWYWMVGTVYELFTIVVENRSSDFQET